MKDHYQVKANSFGAFPCLTTFRGEKRLYTYNKEALVEVDRPDSIARMLVAVTRDGYRTDYPILYDSGKVGWDHPEWFSKGFLAGAAKLILQNEK